MRDRAERHGFPGSPCVMGAGVATNPHFPEFGRHARARLLRSGGSGFDRIFRSGPIPSRVSGFGIAAAAGPQRAFGEMSPLRRSLFRGSFARRLQSRWTSLEIGSGLGFRLSPHASSSLRPTTSSATSILSDHGRIRGGSGPKLSSVSGRPLLATTGRSHRSPSRANGIVLWITSITGITCAASRRPHRTNNRTSVL